MPTEKHTPDEADFRKAIFTSAQEAPLPEIVSESELSNPADTLQEKIEASPVTTLERRRALVTNLDELIQAGKAVALAGPSEVYDRSDYNNLKLRYPNIPQDQIVVAKMEYEGIRKECMACPDLVTMQHCQARYDAANFTSIKWYAVAISDLQVLQ